MVLSMSSCTIIIEFPCISINFTILLCSVLCELEKGRCPCCSNTNQFNCIVFLDGILENVLIGPFERYRDYLDSSFMQGNTFVTVFYPVFCVILFFIVQNRIEAQISHIGQCRTDDIFRYGIYNFGPQGII